MNRTEKKIAEVKARFNQLNRKIKLINLLKGLSLLVVFVLLLNLILSLTEIFGLNSVEERTILFYVGIGLTSLLALSLVVLPAIKFVKPLNNIEILKLARLVGNQFPEIKDKLLNVIQLYENRSDKANSNLTDAAILSELEKTEFVDFKSTASFEKLKRPAIFLTITISTIHLV